jgi:hypothetical protein
MVFKPGVAGTVAGALTVTGAIVIRTIVAAWVAGMGGIAVVIVVVLGIVIRATAVIEAAEMGAMTGESLGRTRDAKTASRPQ